MTNAALALLGQLTASNTVAGWSIVTDGGPVLRVLGMLGVLRVLRALGMLRMLRMLGLLRALRALRVLGVLWMGKVWSDKTVA